MQMVEKLKTALDCNYPPYFSLKQYSDNTSDI